MAAPAAKRVCRARYFHVSGSSPIMSTSQPLTSAEIFVGKRLAPMFEVDNAQAPVAERDPPVAVNTVIVRSPVRDGVAHSANKSLVLPVKAADSAHVLYPGYPEVLVLSRSRDLRSRWNVTLLAIPLRRAREPFFQPDFRLVAQFPLRLFNAESAVLTEPINAPAK